jgi:enhancing lycopene biosynthesis protein 2
LQKAGKQNFLASGNFYGVIPYEGEYDALLPTIFSYNKNLQNFETTGNIPTVDGEIRDAKWINFAGGQKVLVLARNNNSLLFFKQNP